MQEQNDRQNIRHIGLLSASATVAIGAAYDFALVLGLLSLKAPDQPISEPWFSLMEAAILLMMPPFLAMFIAVRCLSSAKEKIWCDLSVVFAALLAGLTSSIHFMILVLAHNPLLASKPWTDFFLTFKWPSLPYALDILAWDVFFGLAALFLAPTFQGGGLRRLIRILLTTSGVLALAGLSGVVLGDIRFRMIGVVGYAMVFPVATGLIGLLLYRERSEPDPTKQLL